MDKGHQELLSIHSIYPINDNFLEVPFLYCLFESSYIRLNDDQKFSDFINLFYYVNENFDNMIALIKRQYIENSLKFADMVLFGYNKGLGELVNFNKFILDQFFPINDSEKV